nr:PREDICTED: uncharacterized protein LOC100878413 [Megachile rotundata]
MDESLNERINRLRQKSRALLAQADWNSKKVKELRRLYSQSLTPNESYKNEVSESLPCKRNIKSWKLRNDSRGVGGALCSDYFCKSPRPVSMPNIKSTKRVLTSTKKHSENQCCSENVIRKPVKGCYCNTNTRKVLRSGKTQHKQHSPCKRCKSHAYTSAVVVEDNEKQLLTSPISCETLRRLQKIDYAPRSQFLRNVQSKVSLLQTNAKGDCPETCSRSQCYHEFMSRRNKYDTDAKHTFNQKSERSDHLTKHESKMPVTVESSKDKTSEVKNVDKSSIGVQVSLKKQSKPKIVIKRTLSSKKSVPDLQKSSQSTKRSPKDCPCCHNKSKYSKSVEDTASDYQPTICINKDPDTSPSDEEVRELRKFREQNYFDTHGSNHTLSSKSSGSLEQYFLNDRLFPEPARKVHRKDLVVTMPACATVQRKRVHYFPRFVVRQEKSANCKKKRFHSCPLTGHAIDLGVTKIRPPMNSLALKYQKRLP